MIIINKFTNFVIYRWNPCLWHWPRFYGNSLCDGHLYLRHVLCDVKASHLCLFGFVVSSLTELSNAKVSFFVAEKVFLVWSPSISSRRLKSSVYLGCMGMIAVYGIVITIMVIGKSSLTTLPSISDALIRRQVGFTT